MKMSRALSFVIALLAGMLLSASAQGQVTFPGPELLGRPTDHSVTINVVANVAIDAYFEYGTQQGGPYPQTSPAAGAGGPASAAANTPLDVVVSGLSADTEYFYRMIYRQTGTSNWTTRDEHSFHTQRLPGDTFSFTVGSDSHINIVFGNPTLYQQTMQNVAAEDPDFHLDLGDTFAMDNVTTQADANSNYLNLRSYFGLMSGSVPVYLALGNHEQEEGWHLGDTNGDLTTSPPVMSTNAREQFYVNPDPLLDSFYSGNTDTSYTAITGSADHTIQDYYAWTWGDALFVVIDPYWYTTVKPYAGNMGGGEPGFPTQPQDADRWRWTLGYVQYQWLEQTLKNSTAKYKFMFAHQVSGGMDDYGRGGANAVPFVEWGGYNIDGTTYNFDSQRPSWGDPDGQLLTKYNVTAFFHGHDHEFAYEKRDGVVYQLVPMAADATYGFGFGDYHETDPYTIKVLPNTGHLRVTVSPSQVTVDYVNAFLPGDGTNGQIAYSYSIAPQTTTATPTLSPAPATFTTQQSVNLSDATGNATIHYTTDGSTPNSMSPTYTVPIVVSTTTTIKAIASASGLNDSAVASGTYTINSDPPPTVSSILPASGTTAGGTSVTITGTGFLAGASLTFGTTPATNIVVVSSTSITATTPAHAAGAVNVVVTNTDSQSGTLTNGYTYTGASGGSISFVQANAGPSTIQSSNTTVAVAYPAAEGAGHLNVVAVGWGDTTSTVSSVTDTQGSLYTLAVGPTSNTGLRQVIYYAKNIAGGSNTVTVRFNQAAAYPDVRILEYAGADPSNPLDQAGAGTGSGTTANSGSVTTTSANELVFSSGTTGTMFSAAGTGYTSRKIDVYGNIAEDKTVTSTGSYNATATTASSAWVMQILTFRSGGQTAPPPTVISIAPTSGTTAGGTSVTITGTGFMSGASATFGTAAATNVVVVSSTSITATTPAHTAGAVNVAVTNTDSQSGTLTNGYTYNSSSPPPTVASIAPPSGTATGGTAVTITGTNFAGGATVTIGGSAATNVVVVSGTQITATTPAGSLGAATVTVTVNGQSGNLANGFTYTATVTVATPTFNPGAGTYSSPQSVSITSTTSGATICYTTDASTPAANSPGTCSNGTALANGGSVLVSTSETLKAIGTENSFTNSAVGSASYTIGNCAQNLTIGNFTLCGESYNDVSSGTSVQVNYSPSPSNGIIAWATWCFNSACNSSIAGVTATIGDNINATESCFVASPHSPFVTDGNGGGQGSGDFQQHYVWYCPSIPSGVTSFKVTPSNPNLSYLQLNITEWKAGSLAASCSPISACFENVDNLGQAGNSTGGTAATITTSGPTVNANDLIFAVTEVPCCSFTASPGTGYTGITVAPSVTPGMVSEAKAAAATGIQTATTTWSGGSAAWFGVIVPLVGTGGAPAAPTVITISPNNGPAAGGTSVTITGTGFLAGASVTFGTTAATNVVVVSSTSITAATPAHAAGAVNVTVTNTDSQSGTLPNAYTYTNPAPTVTLISPTSGTTGGGTAITITGTGFLAGATVSLGGTAATNIVVVSPTSITATTPAHAAVAVNVTVTNTDSQSGTLPNAYTYTNPAPTVTLISPTSGTTGGGTAITITGTGFLAGATVSLGGTAATNVVVVSSTSITAATPAHAGGAVNIVVTNTDSQGGTLTNGYTYTGASGGSISFVQANAGPSTIQSSNTTVAVAYLAAEGAGHLNVVAVGWGDTTSTVSSVTDTLGNMYTPAIGPTSNTGLRQVIYYAKNIAGGSNTVTVRFNQAAAYPDVRILEYAGADPSNPLDQAGAGTGSGTTANSGSVTTTSANELVFASGTTGTAFSAAGTGYTSRKIDVYGNIAEDKTVTSTGSYNATATTTSSVWVMQIVTFK